MLKKEFWKYFFATYKSSKLLIVRYLIVSIYLTVTSIIANKMNLSDLTYYNAIIGLASFGGLIGFGLANGIGLYVNQNIKNKEKVGCYINKGTYLSFIFSFLFVCLLVILYKPVLHIILGLEKGINYNFYFMMLVYIFLDTVLTYFTGILMDLKMYLAKLITSIIQGALLISGFLLIYLKFYLSLILIPYIYIFTALMMLLYTSVYFLKNKEVKVNIFKPTKIKLSKKEMNVIFQMVTSQFVWQIGYSALSFFLLKSNKVYFNQYSYYENVLDIFNGLYFAFVNVTSIDICRKLGEGKFEETYKIGKYSLLASVVIWSVYFLLSISLGSFIIEGMSIDIRDSAYIAIILYVVMHLFRFISWNLISYILCWGGEMKILVWQEVISTFYFIVIYLLSKFIPQNIYLIYGLITMPVIAQTILGLIIFKRKNWMKKLSQEDFQV